MRLLRKQRSKRRGFPLRGPHSYRLLVDGSAFYPAMLDAIRQARRHVLLEMYLCVSGQVVTRFADALCEAVDRGVEVYLLLDGFGCLMLTTRDRQKMSMRGVRIAFYNRLNWQRLRFALVRDHRKLLAVDGQIAYVGGAGLTDHFDPRFSGPLAWHDVMLEVRGPCVTDWEHLFFRTWQRWYRGPVAALPVSAPQYAAPPLPVVGNRREDTGSADGRVVGSTSVGGQTVMRNIIAAMKKARHRIWMTTGYFVPTRRLRRTLKRAVRRGVDVRLLLPGRHTDQTAVWLAGRRFYGRLLAAGVRIFEYQPRCLHAKFVVCDDWLSLGSSNLDHWTLRWNLEANQEVRQSELVDAVAEMFRADLAESHEWTVQNWGGRSWLSRFLEGLFGSLDVWVIRISSALNVRELNKALLHRNDSVGVQSEVDD